nr:hypothetical protein Itr_chr12CG05310 [Ipomoea trifida]
MRRGDGRGGEWSEEVAAWLPTTLRSSQVSFSVRRERSRAEKRVARTTACASGGARFLARRFCFFFFRRAAMVAALLRVQSRRRRYSETGDDGAAARSIPLADTPLDGDAGGGEVCVGDKRR